MMANYESERICYIDFCKKIKEYLALNEEVEKIKSAKKIIQRRDEMGVELRTLFWDQEDNIQRWIAKEPCTFVQPENKKRVRLDIGSDMETFYQFLLFCYEIQKYDKVSYTREVYLAMLISRNRGLV